MMSRRRTTSSRSSPDGPERAAGHATVIQTFRQIPGALWLVLIGMLINRLGTFLQIYLVLYLTQRGFSASEAALALGSYGLGSMAGVLAGGWAADRLGYARTIAGSMAVAGVLTFGLVHLGSLAAVIVVVAVIGAAAQAYRPASSALLVAVTPEEHHVMVFAIYRMAFNLGTTAGPLLGALLLSHSYHLMFYVDAATTAGFALFALALMRSGSGGGGRRTGDAGTRDKEEKAEGEEGEERAGGSGSYRAVLSDLRYVLFMLALFLNAVVYIQHTSALPLQITADGHDETFYATLLSLNAFMIICLELAFTKYVQRLPAKLAVALGIGLVGIGMNLYAAGPGVAVFVIATVGWTLGEMIGTPTASAYPGRVAPPRLRGRYLAAAAFPMQIGYAVGPVIGVAMWQIWPAGVWWLCGLLTVIAVVVTLLGMTDTDQRGADSVDGGTESALPHSEMSDPK